MMSPQEPHQQPQEEDALSGPGTMALSQEEIDRAMEIKTAIVSDPNLDNLSDYEYVQYALALPASEEPMATVMEYAYAMQCFRQEYRITDTLEQGSELFRASLRQHPGFFLAIEYVSNPGNFIAIDDVAAFDPKVLSGYEQRRIGMGGFYYRYQCVSSTFQAIRSGVAIMVECDGCSFSNFDAKVNEQFMVEFFRCYPKRHKEVLFLNSPTIINVAYSLWKKYMNNNMKTAFRLGYQIEGMEGQRIDALFTTPSPAIARQHMVQKVEQFLQLRYRNQKAFSLDNVRASH
jgi:CRAL/TRIO domain